MYYIELLVFTLTFMGVAQFLGDLLGNLIKRPKYKGLIVGIIFLCLLLLLCAIDFLFVT
jgi:hypothetical protein